MAYSPNRNYHAGEEKGNVSVSSLCVLSRWLDRVRKYGRVGVIMLKGARKSRSCDSETDELGEWGGGILTGKHLGGRRRTIVRERSEKDYVAG